MSHVLPLTAEDIQERLLKVPSLDIFSKECNIEGTLIRADIDHALRDGMEIKFKSPADCSQITGLVVYYPNSDGEVVSKEFTFADAHGNAVGNTNLFAENAVVKVILDVDTAMAFVQNADTNAYLESKFVELSESIPTSLPADGGDADTLDGKHASEFASTAAVEALEGLVGNTSVTAQIDNAVDALEAKINAKSDSNHTHSEYVPTSRTVNGKVLSADISLSASDVGAVSKTGDTMTGALEVPNIRVNRNNSLYVMNISSGDTTTSAIRQPTENNQLQFAEYGVGNTTYAEVYCLPVPDGSITAPKWHNILTTKNPVTIAQGGTGATTAADALTNLGAASADHDHDDEYLPVDFVESDPTVPAHVKNITAEDITNWNNKATMADVEEKNYLVAADIAGKADSADVYDKDAIDAKVAALDGEDDRLADLINSKAAQTALDAEVSARETAVSGLQTQINTIMDNPDAEGAINSINEFTTWVAEHGTIADGMRTDINKNKDDIAAEVKRAGEAESALSGRLGTLETTSATKTELQGVAADLSAYEAAHTNDYTNAQIDAAIPDALSDLSSDSTHRTVTDTEKATWNAAKTHADSAHAPSNAERNVIVGIQKNGTDISVDSNRKVNITVPTATSELTNDSDFATNASVTLIKNALQTNIDGKANSSHNHAATEITSGTLSSDRLPTVPITKGGTGATTAAGALTNLGITATAAELNKLDGVTATTAELNYVDGVTSNIQTQLNAKVPTSRTVNGKALSSNISLTAADVGAMATRPNVQVTLSASGWYRVGSVNFYGCYRLTVSPRYSNTQDMGVVLDIVATESNPVINKTAVGHRSSSVRQIDKVRLVKGSTGYAVDIHYNVSAANNVYVRLDGPDGMWVTYAEWSTASDSATAAAICVITPYKTLTSAEYGTSLPTAGNAGRIFFKKVT